MAINSSHIIRNKIEPKELCGAVSQTSNVPAHVMTLTITTTSSINSDSRSGIAQKKVFTSPYLTDNVKLSKLTEKKVVHKKPITFNSSFPLSTNIYKANSDELRSCKRNNKKVKKSVLTLPNESSNDGLVCTVSDANEVTEYNKEQRDRAHKIKSRKRLPMQNKKSRTRAKHFEYYDRDARYCSQMNIDLECSSTDMIKKYNGDGMRASKKNTTSKVSETETKLDPHDVWAVLRNINKFQFTPSPPVSNYSIQSRKKKRTNKKRNTRKDTRVIKTCHTEEFAYISSYDLNRSRASYSRTSSTDRITVIDKEDEFKKFYQEFETRFGTTRDLKEAKNIRVNNKLKSGNRNTNNKKNIKMIRPYCKSIEKSDQLVTLTNKKSNLSTSFDRSPLCLNETNEIKDKIVDINKELDLSAHNETINSVNSGSSKAGLNDFVNKTKADKFKPVYSDESNQQLKGITKVVVSKAPESSTVSKQSPPIRKPRLVTTMPSTTITPKLSLPETKRRQMTNLRFPIVILEKDELGCSSIEVPTFEPIQFRGLDNHIWPFMKDWQIDTSVNRKKILKHNNSVSPERIQQEKSKRNVPKINNNLPENKVVTPNHKKFFINNTKKTDPKRTNILMESRNIVQQPTTKTKPIKQFKDKMLKLLYKKSVEDLIHKHNQTCGQGDMIKLRTIQNANNEKTIKKIDTGTDTVNIISSQQNSIQSNERLMRSFKKKEEVQFNLPSVKHPWARGKWASDFIDSVIKKIKSGIYYSQDNKTLCKRCNKEINLKEASIQTAVTMTTEEDFNVIEDTANTCDNKIIPGFDDALAPVEIKTLNMKQITVKHCLTNVLLQFDVSIPTDKKPLNPTNPSEPQKHLCTPLAITEGNFKIFKCKTTILNAIMPAELCSIIPKMMRSLTDFNTSFYVTYPPILSRKPESQLATIKELTHPTSIDSLNYSITPYTFMSTELKTFLAGKFLYNVFDIQNKKKTKIATSRIVRNVRDINVFPELCAHHILYVNATVTVNKLCNLSFRNETLPHMESSKCMALQPIVTPKQYATPTFGIHNVIKLLQNICFNNIVVNFDFPKYCPMRFSDVKISFYQNSFTDNTIRDLLSVTKNVDIDSIFMKTIHNRSQQNCFTNTMKCIDYDKRKSPIQDKKLKSIHNLCHIKTKKKCFVRLYKKCKSTSNISLEKSSTALSKITNLDNFLLALGSGKLLSSVFDGYSEKKILSSIIEMKNWISDISQRQAMLVLLLTNKKDTPNLVRYRPVLLQGIAVNRITRASELDMEIEVIETENVSKLSQYEGISYVTASTENSNLLEELYWIAKTTASDYQKPFDESSERLLKSLTEKRKTLNPSYLRVMARYVGLGLLKHPKK